MAGLAPRQCDLPRILELFLKIWNPITGFWNFSKMEDQSSIATLSHLSPDLRAQRESIHGFVDDPWCQATIRRAPIAQGRDKIRERYR